MRRQAVERPVKPSDFKSWFSRQPRKDNVMSDFAPGVPNNVMIKKVGALKVGDMVFNKTIFQTVKSITIGSGFVTVSMDTPDPQYQVSYSWSPDADVLVMP